MVLQRCRAYGAAAGTPPPDNHNVVAALSPAVARDELPWDHAREIMNSEGVPSIGRARVIREVDDHGRAVGCNSCCWRTEDR